MLKELRIRNYAVIDDLALEPGGGLVVLTGETGAGKSIVVGALSLLLGERASAEDVRAGEERARVEAVFDVREREDVRARCAEAGIEAEEDWLVLRREVQREGRNRAWVNGSPATAGLVWELGSRLVELHGQHEHQRLLRGSAQRALLDDWAGVGELARDVAEGHARLEALRAEIGHLRRREAEVRERADYLRFRAEEVEKARLEPGEEERLRSEAARLENSEELTALSGSLYEELYAGEGSVVERLGVSRRTLRELVRLDPGAGELLEMLEAGRAEIEELGRRLGAYLGSIDHDPARLARLRSRLDEIFRLERKYGGSVEEVLEAGRRARAELAELEGAGERLEALEREAEAIEARLGERAARLTELRREAAARLRAEVEPLLAELGMEGGRFEVGLEPLGGVGRHGAERVELRVSLNPGFEPGPLSRVASGGELSRVMLALRTVLARQDDVPTLVFDEIDAGVGGEVAHRVAEKLAAVAEDRQVFVITHLAQIAARARHHLRVEKETGRERAATRLRELSGEGRIEELARLLGGDPESELSREHARELLRTGEGAA